MYRKNTFIVLCFVMIFVSDEHLLPEDSVTDNEEQLNREKRDSFLDSILKTIPFFNPAPSMEPGNLDDPVDPNDLDEITEVKPKMSTTSITSTNSIMKSSVAAANSSINRSTQGITLSTALLPTTTKFPFSQSKTSFSIAPTLIPVFSSSFVITSLTAALVNKTITTNITSTKGLSIFLSKTSFKFNAKPTLTYPTASSIVKITPTVSQKISPSSKTMHAFTTSNRHSNENVIKMMIVPAEGAKLPNENGYGDSLANKDNTVVPDLKNIRFLYRNVLIPVMSGILGALSITFAIVMYRCLRRRKLQKMRYYGGKPNSALYRLDHMNLLSDDSSDEE